MLLLCAWLAATSIEAEQYARMRADTQRKGREIEMVMRTMVPLGRRVDECVLIAAPNDQDWEGEFVAKDGARTSLKVGFDRDGNIAFLFLRPRPDLPPDPHAADAPVHLALPVVDRPLVAFSGGPTRMWNQHVYNPDQRHAVDIVSWENGGSYGDGEGLVNEDYAIFGADVRAPIAGTVVFVDTEANDHEKPQREWNDDAHPFGNVVVIRIEPVVADERFVVLGHMKKGSVVVTTGQTVKAGQLVGHVGNSGNSSEPHLHMHVQDGPVPKQGLSVPFVVDGRPIRRGVFMEAKRKPAPKPTPTVRPEDVPPTLTTDPRQ